MVFNSDSYHANKFRRAAWADLARAREYRAAGNVEMAKLYARSARADMHLSLNFKECAALGKAQRRRT